MQKSKTGRKAGTAERQSRYRKGLAAEYLAALVYLSRGYKIAARRYKTPVGEIDLICRRKNTLVFIEVKWRPNEKDGREAVHAGARNRITRAAQWYLSACPQPAGRDIRFDVFVYAPPFSISRLENAWQSEI